MSMVLTETKSKPGPIDNSDIVAGGSGSEDEDPELHRYLLEGRDYVLVPQEVWEKLFDWYWLGI